MDEYDLEAFQRDLRDRLKPHSIGARVISERLPEVTVETWRSNGTQTTKTFRFTVHLLIPAFAQRVAALVLEHYDSAR